MSELPEGLILGAEAVRRFDRLSDRQWQAMVMRMQGASYRQIGEVLGISVEGARSLLLRAGRRLGFQPRLWWHCSFEGPPAEKFLARLTSSDVPS